MLLTCITALTTVFSICIPFCLRKHIFFLPCSSKLSRFYSLPISKTHILIFMCYHGTLLSGTSCTTVSNLISVFKSGFFEIKLRSINFLFTCPQNCNLKSPVLPLYNTDGLERVAYISVLQTQLLDQEECCLIQQFLMLLLPDRFPHP